MVEIGDLDHALLLPTQGRIKRGMKTICDSCGKPITDKQFVGGFKKGYPNMKFHEKCCPLLSMIIHAEGCSHQ